MIGTGRLLPTEARALPCRIGSSILCCNNTRQGYVRKDTLKLAGFSFLGRADEV